MYLLFDSPGLSISQRIQISQGIQKEYSPYHTKQPISRRISSQQHSQNLPANPDCFFFCAQATGKVARIFHILLSKFNLLQHSECLLVLLFFSFPAIRVKELILPAFVHERKLGFSLGELKTYKCFLLFDSRARMQWGILKICVLLMSSQFVNILLLLPHCSDHIHWEN